MSEIIKQYLLNNQTNVRTADTDAIAKEYNAVMTRCVEDNKKRHEEARKQVLESLSDDEIVFIVEKYSKKVSNAFENKQMISNDTDFEK